MRLLFLSLLLPTFLMGDSLRMMVDNHEEELRAFEERLANQETIMDSLRGSMQESGTQQKNQLNATISTQERQIKSLQERIVELEKKTMAQAHQINLLQDALKTFVDTFQTTTSVQDYGSTKVYVVKNGDSLGKIAKAHHTTSQTLREMNSLNGDRIIIGQKLRVPES
jgi:LysM repeat protein